MSYLLANVKEDSQRANQIQMHLNEIENDLPIFLIAFGEVSS